MIQEPELSESRVGLKRVDGVYRLPIRSESDAVSHDLGVTWAICR
jgi:hypothetical protein